METHGWLSLVPPLLAIVLAIWSKQVMPSLVAGIWAGSVVLESGNPLAGSIRTVDKIVAVFESPGNTRVVLFSVLVGGLIALMQRSGGVQGFVLSMQQRPIGQTHRGAGLLAMITGIVIFIESSLTCLIVGTLLLVLFVVLTRKDFGPMRAAEQRAMQEGKLIADGAQPLVSADVTEIEAPSDTPLRMRNMLIPMGVLTMAVPAGLYATGSLAIRQASSSAQGNPSPTFLSILENGSGSTAVLWGVLLAIFVAAILYRAQGIMRLDEMMRFLVQGVGGLVPMAILITGAFALGASCRELGTGAYVAGILDRSALQPQWYPAVLFLTGSVIAFATGTSWGTFAIMIPIAVPLMTGHEHLLPLAVAGVLG